MNRIDYTAYAARGGDFAAYAQHELPERLCEAWCRDYRNSFRDADIVSIAAGSFSHLFDLTAERTLAAYGVSGGKVSTPRDRSRMAGHPKAEGRDYHRGHLIPHSAGGGMDINLFIQRGAVNIGRFRELENLAVGNPGSFYFVRLIYGSDGGQRPAFVEQGVFVNSKSSRIEDRFHPN